ncbi:MAG: alpha-2-macroglobulin [Myxococcota bacterium]
MADDTSNQDPERTPGAAGAEPEGGPAESAKTWGLVVFAGLALLFAVLWIGERNRNPKAGPPPAEALLDREPVTWVDVLVDREHRRHLDLVFDRPLGDDQLGEVLAPPPVRLTPHTGGIWSWNAANVLRFTPTHRLAPATRYEIELLTDALLGPERALLGDPRVEVETDAFQVERALSHEEPVPDAAHRVRLRGELRFNYDVEPRELAPLLVLRDPEGSGEDVPIELELSYASRIIGWRSAPVEKGAASRELVLAVGPSLTPAEGNVELGAEWSRTLPLGSRGVLAVRGIRSRPGESESRIEIELSSAVDLELARDHLEVEPAVEFRATAERNQLNLVGAFEPGERYRVALLQGLRSRDGAVLRGKHEEEVRLPDLPASARFHGEGMFLSARGRRSLGIETMNLDQVTVSIDRVYRNNVLYLVQQRGYQVYRNRGYGGVDRVFGDRIVEKKLSIEGPRNQTQTTELRIDDWLEDGEPGFYRVGLRREGSYHLEQRWVLITDLGLVAKRGTGDLLVWASSFDDLAPIRGARVRVVSDQNQEIASGRTDPRGMLHFRGLEEHFAEHRPAYVLVERGDDWSFLALDRTRIETSGLDVHGSSEAPHGYDALLYGERDLYRPGETARGVALLRDAELRVPPDMPLLLRHKDPMGQERSTQRLALGAQGAAEWSVFLEETSFTGAHRLELVVGEDVVGRYRFQVEEFVPDRIAVEIDSEGEALPQPGAALRYQVASHYLFGAPASGLAVESRVSLEAAPFVPPGHTGFSFRNDDRKFSRRELLAREGSLDEEGKQRFEVAVPDGLEVPSSLVAVVTARVRESGGRGVAAHTRIPVHPYPYYLGLRQREAGYAEPGQPVSFELVGAAPDGSEVDTGTLQVEFLRDEWQTVLRRTASGSYRYESVLEAHVFGRQTLPGGRTRHSFEVTPPEYGRYRVVVTDPKTGASSRLTFYASGWGFAPWAVENPGRVELDLERDDLRPGESAVVQVRAPFPGKLLVTVERNGVLHKEVRQLEGNTARLELPVRADWRPNVYVTATLVRGADQLEPGSAARAFGAVPLSVDRERHRMPVALELPNELRPSAPLEFAVTAAPRSWVTVAAVDEGVLQLVGQESPDPFGHFYRRRALSVSSHDVFSFLLPDLDLEGEADAGGGSGGAGRTQFLRTEGIRRVKPVAFWSGPLQTDASGRAQVRFELPEFQGALRVMAVAYRDADFGAATELTRVRQPLMLTPTPPRFLSFGERVEVPVTVRNDTGKDAEVQVRFEVEGPVTFEGEALQTLAIADGSETTVRFPLDSGEAEGEVVLRVFAEAGDEEARVERSFGLRPDLPNRTLETVGAVTQSGVLLRSIDDGLRKDGRTRSLWIGPHPAVQLYGRLGDLLRYPYGCLEQTVSRAFPLVGLGEWAEAMEPGLFEDRDPALWVEAAVRRIASMQLARGGFSLWPRGREAHPWASVYAAHFLVEAERAGHTSAQTALPGALAYAKREAVAKPRYSAPELERVVYALYVLARAGDPDRATMDFLRERHADALTATSRVLLGAAYAASGDPSVLPELATALDDTETVRRQTGGNFASTTRNRSLFLLGLLDAAPEDPRIPKLASQLGRDALDERWNTQESALALIALGQLFREAGSAVYQGSVFVGGKQIGQFDQDTRVFEWLPEGDIEILIDGGDARTRAYYVLRHRGTPTDAAFQTESRGLEIERSWLDRNGVAITDNTVSQGELVVAKLRLRSVRGRIENLVVQQLLPAGFEVENPRLQSSETLPWVANQKQLSSQYLDARDDRILLFTRIGRGDWREAYLLLRAVNPGRFRLPPVQVEAMYAPGLRAVGPRGEFVIQAR